MRSAAPIRIRTAGLWRHSRSGGRFPPGAGDDLQRDRCGSVTWLRPGLSLWLPTVVPGEIPRPFCNLCDGIASPEAAPVMTASPRTEVVDQPSTTDELAWALTRIRNAGARGEPPNLAEGVEVSPELTRRVTEFWTDGGTTFEELFVLGHWSATASREQPTLFLEKLEQTLETAASRRMALSSNRPDDRAVLERRI